MIHLLLTSTYVYGIMSFTGGCMDGYLLGGLLVLILVLVYFGCTRDPLDGDDI